MAVRPHCSHSRSGMCDRCFRPSHHKGLTTEQTLQHFAQNDKLFNRACAMASVKPTRRQASKFKRGWGTAASKLPEAAQNVVSEEAL